MPRRLVTTAAAVLCLLAPTAAAEAPPESPADVSNVADGALTLLLAGDSIITQPWSGDREPAFLDLVARVRAADVALVNLELVLHDFDNPAQADSGGGHMAARPAMAGELAWAGVDMVAHANNHSFDYGSGGVLATGDAAARAGLVLAGSGPDLQRARAPAYLTRPDGTVALVATASTFTPYGKASRSRADVPGRPGLNPLTAVPLRHLAVPGFLESAFWGTADLLGLPHRRWDDGWGKLYSLSVHTGTGLGLRRGFRVDRDDVEANLAAVRAAAARADVVVFSIHAHDQGPWLEELAHRAVDAGADVFLAHGPHRMLGVELHRGRPIFYGLGDFVFQPHRVERFPTEHYERNRLGEGATVEDVRRKFVTGSKLYGEREPWESVAAVLRYEAGALREVRLLPMDLGFREPLPVRDKAQLADDRTLGKPRRADRTLGRRIVDTIGDRSRPYGTAIRYLDGENAGLVVLP